MGSIYSTISGVKVAVESAQWCLNGDCSRNSPGIAGSIAWGVSGGNEAPGTFTYKSHMGHEMKITFYFPHYSQENIVAS